MITVIALVITMIIKERKRRRSSGIMITVIARVITLITLQTDFYQVTRLSLTTVSMTVAALAVAALESRKKIQMHFYPPSPLSLLAK